MCLLYYLFPCPFLLLQLAWHFVPLRLALLKLVLWHSEQKQGHYIGAENAFLSSFTSCLDDSDVGFN